ncbi:aminotransferase class IV [Pseudoponticoccus marisrubri]|uniref:Probable branched-chain-amino-acid aminotransferase n=1 Tax=Pseudoponticoccus marisrubri TaxID=1685382 RepID=A0A0W7WF57_9RHOB|nr:aminotransferase class IV [Pseudoponticoccus marisrubri]KUF09111.1 branched-chain amino acid--2-keto-4-methylthiobutyrate aminotransferase [Pseudoponticoccus marisrubri]
MTDLSAGAAWMAGRILPIAEAKIGVTDWALTHSDTVYDVVPVVGGAFFRLPDYLARFRASVQAGRFEIGMEDAEIAAALSSMVAASGLRDAYCAMVAARGTPRVPGDRDPRNCRNHFYAWAVPYVHVIKPEVIAAGASVWIAKMVRRIPPDSVNPRAKNYHWGDFTAGLFEAKEAGFETVLLCDHAGHVAEGPGFNAFAVIGDRVVTPETGVLEGITRRTVLEICAELGLATEIRPLPLEEFMAADEVFLSSSGGGVLPITRVDDRIFGNGVAGPVARQLHARYWDWTRRPEHRTPVPYPG